jgi:hypothetical protein
MDSKRSKDIFELMVRPANNLKPDRKFYRRAIALSCLFCE